MSCWTNDGGVVSGAEDSRLLVNNNAKAYTTCCPQTQPHHPHPHKALPPLTPQQKELCVRALDYFQNGDYAECSTIFADILSHRLSDYRLSHNLIVSSFWQNHCRDLQGTFLPQLLGILDEASISLENICDEGIVHPVLLHNLAVVYYYDGQYSKSLDLVHKLLKSLPNSTSTLTKRLKLLNIELLVQLQLYDQALLQITRIQKKLGTNQTHSPSPLGLGLDTRDSSTDEFRLLLMNNPSATAQDSVPPGAGTQNPKLNDYSTGFKFKLQELKTRCELGMRNLESATGVGSELKILGAMCRSGENQAENNYSAQIRPTFFNLKAYHNYLKGNIRKGLRKLDFIQENYDDAQFMKTGDNLNVIYNNDSGVCQYALGKPIVSAWYFQKASEEINKPQYKYRHNLPIQCLNIFNRKYEIMYNFGVSLLHAKQLVEAFNVLSICSKVYPCNPRIWLRLAETCVRIYKFNEGPSSERSRAYSGPDPNSNSECRFSSLNLEKPSPTLSFGLYCIEQGLKLMDPELISQNNGILPVPPSTPLRNRTEISTLRGSLYCIGVFLSLRLEYYSYSITLCQQLAGMGGGVPNAWIYLGKMYLGKALLSIGEPFKALEIYNEIRDFDTRHYNNPCVQANINTNTSRAYTSSPSHNSPSASTQLTPNINISPISWSGSNHNSSTGTGATELGEYKPASDWYPNNELNAQSDVVQNQIVLLTRLGRFPEAAQLVENWKTRLASAGTLPSRDFIHLEAYVYFALGNVPRAEQLMSQFKNP